ncbi:MAG: galactose-1-epimerase, partial [Lachnospiraceae bacterium]|nr:galactose-1-epimerase [Lachnospiraceae bacterium]
TPSDEHSICHGDITDVKGTPMDFTTPTKIGERINEEYDQLIWGNGYDHNYILNGNSSIPAATLTAPDNSLTLNIYTTAPCLQLYSGNYLSSDDIGKDGHHYSPRSGVALETQFAPNAINVDRFIKPILNKGEQGYSCSIYEFI